MSWLVGKESRAVNKPSRSFIVPGEGPFWGLSRIESAYTRHVNVKCRYEIRTAKNITDGWYGYERSFKTNKAFTTRALVPSPGTVKLRRVPFPGLFVTSQLPESRHQGFLLLSQKQVFFIQTRYFLILQNILKNKKNEIVIVSKIYKENLY